MLVTSGYPGETWLRGISTQRSPTRGARREEGRLIERFRDLKFLTAEVQRYGEVAQRIERRILRMQADFNVRN